MTDSNPQLFRSEAAVSGKTRRGTWTRTRWIVLPAAALLLLQWALDWTVQRPRVATRLSARLAAAFGRPVKVGRYHFTLWIGPELEADSVTVGEDLRFGNEYFLRADSVRFRPRLVPLLRGRIALSGLSFDHPSLNIVVNPDGVWNLAEWLPKNGGNGTRSQSAPAFSRLEFNEGRINFKAGQLKLPFALELVNGTVEQEATGRWGIRLDAQPMRAAVLLQRLGNIHVEGTVGGTTARLRPANLQMTWQAGSIADLLRFVYGDDLGARGDFSISLSAHAEGPAWVLSGQAQCRRLHRWDLPSRPDNPTFNIAAAGAWIPAKDQLQLAAFHLEAPRSNALASGVFAWRRASRKPVSPLDRADFTVQATLGMEDALAFWRAFHGGVAPELSAHGQTTFNLHGAGWPPQIDQGELAANGIRLEGGSLFSPLRTEPCDLKKQHGEWTLSGARIVFEPKAGDLSLNLGSFKRAMKPYTLSVQGGIDDVAALTSFAAAMGYSLPSGWGISGPATAALQWGLGGGLLSQWPSGSIGLDGVRLRAPFLTREVGPITAGLNFSKNATQLNLKRAEAFGGDWSGILIHVHGADGWRGSLTADSAGVSEFSEYLNPEKRVSLLDRLFPFLESQQEPVHVPTGLKWTGNLQVGTFQFRSLRFEHLRGKASLDGRTIRLTAVNAGFLGGNLMGSFTAHLKPLPEYEAALAFHRAALDELPVSWVAHRFGGVAGGTIRMSAKGLDKDGLLNSLRCDGSAEVSKAQIKFLDLLGPFDGDALRPGQSAFPMVMAEFRCDDGIVNFKYLSFRGRAFAVNGEGSVDFKRNVDLLLTKAGKTPPAESGESGVSNMPRQIRLTGPLDSLSASPAH